jgi:hypothetical protein
MLRCLETTASITTAIHATSNCLPNVSVHPNLFEYGGCYSYGDDRSAQALPGLSQSEVEGRYAGYKCLEGIPHGLGGMLHYPHFTSHFTYFLLHSSLYFTSHFTSLLTGMESGWFAGRFSKETVPDFQRRMTAIASWLWDLADTDGEAEAKSTTPTSTGIFENDSTSNIGNNGSSSSSSSDNRKTHNTVVLVCHGHVITTLMNLFLFNTHRACIFPHYNTGITTLQLAIAPSGKRIGSLQSSNAVPHLQHKDEYLKSGNLLVTDQWIKIFREE